MKRKAMAIVLMAAMILPATGCDKSKKKESGDTSETNLSDNDRTQDGYVKESDPYFSDTTTDLSIPFEPDPSHEATALEANDACLCGDSIVISYMINYAPTEEEKKAMDTTNYESPDELMKYYEISASLSESGLILLDLQGNPRGKIKMGSNESLYSIQSLKNDRIGVGVSVFVPESMMYEHKLLILNSKGEREAEIDISDREGARFYELSSGKILLADPSEKELIVVDDQGNRSEPVKYSDEFEGFFEIDGKGYILTRRDEYLEEVVFHHYLTETDPEKGTIGSPKEISANIPYRFLESNGKYYADDDDGSLLLYDIVSGKSEAVFHPEDLDTLIRGVTDVEFTPENDIYVLQTTRMGLGELQETSFSITRLHREAKNPHAGKRIVRVCSCNSDVLDIRRMAAAYNKRAESKARVITYVQNQDLSMGFDKAEANAADELLLAMKSGEGPDVVLNCAEYGQFNSDSILVDLNTYMDGNAGIDRSLYYDNIFRAFEADGKLFQLPVTVSMVGFNGDKKVLGDIEQWDLKLFEQKIDALGNSVYPAAGHFLDDKYVYESSGLFHGFLYCDMAHYVDYSKREAYFDSDDFRKVLELSKKYGGRISGDKLSSLNEQYDDMLGDHRQESLMMQDGVVALSTMYVANLRDFAAYSDLCGGDPLFIGWPTSKDSGMTAVATISVGMSAFSECKDEAWDFIRFLLSPEAQNILVESDVPDIFVCRECEEADMKKQIETYQKKMKRITEYTDDPAMIKAQSVIDEQTAKRFTSIIERIHSSVNTNPKILEIVLEEAAGYFEGQKSADEVCKSIQNRITMYLAETK